MMRRLTAVAASAGVFLTASLASAQAHDGFGRQGQFILSADRLVPVFSFTHVSQDRFNPPGGVTKIVDTVNQTSISLLWGAVNPTVVNGTLLVNPFAVPRLGVDYVLLPHFTVGGDLIVFFTLGGSTSIEQDNNNGSTQTQSNDNPSTLIFGVAPRAGYIWQLTDLFSLWLRGGLSYYVETNKTTTTIANTTTTTTISVNQFALDLDPQFVITPVPHLGFTLGLTGDIPLAGGHSTATDTNGRSTTNSASSSLAFFGITAGILGYF